MENNSERIINSILDSYEQHEETIHVDTENIVNKEILIEVMKEIRKVLFPGFFEQNRVRSEYLKYLVGERVEYIQYHLKKQVARVLGNADGCECCPKSEVSSQAEEIVHQFLLRIPVIREYLYTDVQAAYEGDPARTAPTK